MGWEFDPQSGNGKTGNTGQKVHKGSPHIHLGTSVSTLTHALTVNWCHNGLSIPLESERLAVRTLSESDQSLQKWDFMRCLLAWRSEFLHHWAWTIPIGWHPWGGGNSSLGNVPLSAVRKVAQLLWRRSPLLWRRWYPEHPGKWRYFPPVQWLC